MVEQKSTVITKTQAYNSTKTQRIILKNFMKLTPNLINSLSQNYSRYMLTS